MVVVVVTVLFTYYQENRSRKIMASFAKMTPPLAQVETGEHSKQFAMLTELGGEGWRPERD